MTNRQLELKIGAPVDATDQPIGHVHKVIVIPAHRHVVAVVGLVIRTGLLPPHDLFVPTSLIADATDTRVALRISHADVLRLPGAPEQDSTIALRRGHPVDATDGRAGRVELLLVEDGGQMQHFVMRKGRVRSRDVIVPVDWISTLDEHGIWLVVDRAALDQLPPYRPDSIIAADVEQALWADEVIRALDLETIDATVNDGVVILNGHASTPATKARAERAARQVPGVQGVVNQIITDGEVEVAVSQALAHDPRTCEQHIFVSANHGIVTLSGTFDGTDTRAAAEQVAGSVPLVRGVINELQAPGVVVDPAEQRMLQPQIGQDVYADDALLGRVELVVINPRNRRVSAFVARGRLPAFPQAEANTRSVDIPLVERHIHIPINVVFDVTSGGVLLTISLADATHYPDFNPSEFVAPDPSWQPPYPYTHADVMFELSQADIKQTAPALDPGANQPPIWQQISRGTPVLFLDGVRGIVDQIWLAPGHEGDGQIAVRVGGPLPKDTIIPLQWVRRLDENGIYVEVAAEQLAAHPEAAALQVQQAQSAGK